MQSLLFSSISKRTGALAVGAAAMGVLSMPVFASDVLARVVSSTPVVQQFAVPRQICENSGVVSRAPTTSGAGAVMGAIAGGAAGNAIGNGNGRALATVIGLVGGAIAGNSIEGGGSFNNQTQSITQCSTQTFYENRVSHYNVVYDYQGTQSTLQMANDPGAYVRLQLTPVGSGFSQDQSGYVQPLRQGRIQQQTPEIRPQLFNPPPRVYYYPQQPAFIEQQRIYVQPIQGATIIEPQVIVVPGAYPGRRFYQQQHHQQYVHPRAPIYHQPPVGLSLNFGYSRNDGHGYRHSNRAHGRSGGSVYFGQ